MPAQLLGWRCTITASNFNRDKMENMKPLASEKILEGLNPPQREAVETISGPLLILAGAGSGKTKTLTHRIAYLIATGHARPQDVLAVTFTNKAAGEMRERLAKLLGVDNNRSFMPWMGTFHSIAVRILHYYGDSIGIPSNFVIFDESDRLVLVKSILKDLGATDKKYSPRTIVSYISNAKNDCLSPDQYYKSASTPLQQMAAEVYMRYGKRMKENDALDFDDLLLETVRLLKESPDVRQKLQNRFRYILIDEYQDTNRAQYEIVKSLLNKERNICAVGDDWQSIYSWRGADFTNILHFERDFSGAKVVKLEQNYRSTQKILDAAHNVISKNNNKTDKKLWTNNKGGKPVEIIETYNGINEAEQIANRIESEVAVGARSYRDFAILYRTNAQSRVFEQMFLRDSIPYKIIGGLRFYDRAEIKDLTAYLKLLYQPNDTVSFMRIANVPKRSLGAVSLTKFVSWQATTGKNVIDALSSAALCPGLTQRASRALMQLGTDLADIKSKVDSVTPDQIIEMIIKRFGYDRYIDDGGDQGEARKENIGELITVAKEFGDLNSFLEEVALISGADAANNDDAVTLMTLHAAKGLEFPVVYMVGMEDGLFPTARAEINENDMEEERRLCYVGMTRAKEELTLTWADQRVLHGETRFNQPSPFLLDIDETQAVRQRGQGDGVDAEPSYDDYSSSYNRKQLGRNRWNSSTSSGRSSRARTAGNQGETYYEPDYSQLELRLTVGDKIHHMMFGIGTVIAVDGTVAEVKFANGKQTKLNTNFAPIQKL